MMHPAPETGVGTTTPPGRHVTDMVFLGWDELSAKFESQFH